MAGQTLNVGILEAVIRLRDTMSPALDNAAKKLRRFGGRVTRTGQQLTRGLTLPIVAVGGAAIAASETYAEAMRQIAVGTGATGAALDGLTASFDRVFGTVPDSAETVSRVLADLNTVTGATGTTLEELAVALLDSSRVLGEEAAPNAIKFARSLEQFNIPAEQGTATLDMFFATAQRTGASMGDLISQTGTFSVVLKNVGFSLEESVALFGSLSKGSIEVTRVMPGLNAAFRRWADEGLNVKETLGATIAQMKGAASSTESLNIATTAFGAEGASRLNDAVREGKFNLEAMAAAVDGTRGSIVAVTADSKTFTETLKVLRNRATIALAPFGDELKRALTGFLPVLEGVATTINSVAARFGALSPKLKNTILIVVGVAAALGPLLMVAGAVATSVGALIPIFTSVGAFLFGTATAAAALAGALAFLVTWPGVLTVAVVLLTLKFKPFRDLLFSIGKLIKNYVIVVFKMWVTVLGTAWGAIRKVGAAVRDFLGPVINVVGKVFSFFGDKVEAVADLLDTSREAAEDVVPAVEAVAAVVEDAGDEFKHAAVTAVTFSDEALRLRDTLSGAGLAGEVTRLEEAFEAMSAEMLADRATMRRLGEAAIVLDGKGAILEGGLLDAADAIRDAKAAKEALDVAFAKGEAISTLADSLGEFGLVRAAEDLDSAWAQVVIRGGDTETAIAGVAVRAGELSAKGVTLSDDLREVVRQTRAAETAKRNLDRELAKLAAVTALADEISGRGLTGEVEKLNAAWLQAIEDGPVTGAMMDDLGGRAIALAEDGAVLAGAAKVAAERLQDEATAIKAADDAAKASEAAFDGMIASMRSLAEIMGGTGGGILKALGGFVSGVDVAKSSAAAFRDGLSSIRDGEGGIVSSLSSMAAGLMGMAGIAIQAGKAIVSAFKKIGRSIADNVMLRAGREWGIKLSEGLAKKIEETSKKIGHDYAATLLHLGEIFAESGELMAGSMEKPIAMTRDLFVMIETGKLLVSEAGPVFDAVFGRILPNAIDKGTGLARADFLELIELSRKFGVESANVAKFVADQTKAGMSALSAYMKTATSETTSGIALSSSAALEFFNAQMAAGASFTDVVRAMGPTFNEIGGRMAAAGVTGSAAFGRIRAAAALVTGETTGPMIDGVDAAVGILRALANIGSEELGPTFATVGDQVRTTFDALIAGGTDSATAMLALEGPLGTLIALQDEHGFEIDEATQALIEQAREAGVTGQAQKSAQDRTADAVERLADIMEDVFRRRIPGAADVGARAIEERFGAAIANIGDEIERMPPIEFPVSFARPNVGGIEIPSLQGGTGGFRDFGAGTLAMLHGREAVVREGDAAPGTDALAREIAGLRRDLATDRSFQSQLVPKMLQAVLQQQGAIN